MTEAEIIGALLAALGCVLWWLMRSNKAQGDTNEKELAAFKLHCSETYAKESIMQKNFDTLFAKIDEFKKEVVDLGKDFRAELKTKADKE